MRIVVFSDVHGNSLALKEMFLMCQKYNITKYIHCGDIFGYFYNQKEVIDLFIKNDVISIMGNHDKYFLDFYDHQIDSSVLEKYGHSYDINRKELDFKYIQYVRKLPLFYQMEYNNLKIMFYHGSPTNPLEGRHYPDKTESLEKYNLSNVLFLGHTHYRMKFRTKDALVLNPGSLGLPRDSNGFSFLLCDLSKMEFEFLNININFVDLMSEIPDNDTIKEDIYKVLNRKR